MPSSMRLALLATLTMTACARVPAKPAAPSAPPASAVPATLRTCATDADCAAVDRVGCCHNGWKEAVAVSQKEAYAAAFVCADPHPICAMYIVLDGRAAACEKATRLCELLTTPDRDR